MVYELKQNDQYLGWERRLCYFSATEQTIKLLYRPERLNKRAIMSTRITPALHQSNNNLERVTNETF